jgi:hypothetical protein
MKPVATQGERLRLLRDGVGKKRQLVKLFGRVRGGCEVRKASEGYYWHGPQMQSG